jgi:hypothetical protein
LNGGFIKLHVLVDVANGQFGCVGCLKGRDRSAIEFYSTISQQARK